MKNLPANYKAILKFSLPFFITLILFIFMLKFGLSKISEVRSKISESKNNQAILKQKLNLLTQVDEGVLLSSNLTLVALPESNPTLTITSQLKRMASQKGMFLTNIKTGSETEEKSKGLKRIDISFDIESNKDLVFEFLSDLKNIAPIILIDKVKMNETAGVARASIVVRAFWMELPKKLTPINEAIKDLTQDEKDILQTVSGLVQPVFIEIPAQDTPSTKTDPFSF